MIQKKPSNGVSFISTELESIIEPAQEPRPTLKSLHSYRPLGEAPKSEAITSKDSTLPTIFLNGSLPKSLFEVIELQFLDLSNNLIVEELPEVMPMKMTNLKALKLSDNALV